MKSQTNSTKTPRTRRIVPIEGESLIDQNKDNSNFSNSNNTKRKKNKKEVIGKLLRGSSAMP